MTRYSVRGFDIWRGLIAPGDQAALVNDVRAVCQIAPMFHPFTRFGKQMRVKMTSAGKVGWFSDRNGYRYTEKHPDGQPWPCIPTSVLSIWNEVTGLDRAPDCCLINYYDKDARMGLHQDKDEADFDWPVVSISLGDAGLFRMGNVTRGGQTESIWLQSGDVVKMGGPARLAYHGVDRIRFGSSQLLKNGGRINLTLRVVD